jgi:hypothetical protein
MIRPTTLGFLTLLALAAPAVASAAPKPPVAAQLVRAPTTPQKATPADGSSYAKREQQNPQVAKYEGGSMIVVGISGGALLVILLVLLLI